MLETVLEGVRLRSRGKVRDIYDLGDHLLLVSTDRISAFDCVLPNGIPGKGRVLNLLSEFWFRATREIVPNHLVTTAVEEYPAEIRRHGEILRHRSMLARKADMIPVECVVRGYLAGSGWREYRETGRLAGIEMPRGLRVAERLPGPVFHPAVKATRGHDENLTYADLVARIGSDLAARLREASLRLYEAGVRRAGASGVLIADTKFEFGRLDGGLVLADELFTPDSSRFWRREEYRPGTAPEAFDKQFVRDYLESVGWDKRPPAPVLPEEVVRETAGRYREIFRVLTGREAP
ncbi:MAG: phosphoribosylaminoimidazolesuccinocarboxamide synthase [Acidobacteria bacterium]|nr:phosphoribosylaminoimidazolesuccinocarboxamide synthase [Acidobacteriota bacterium]